VFNLISSVGTAILMLGTAIGLYNLIVSWRNGKRASSNPWGAPTIEWTIPSPPPEYNFAELPVVKSRYPLWNMKPGETLVHETTWEEEKDKHIPTAKELGIVLPNPSIMPLIVAFGIVFMFCGTLVYPHNWNLGMAGMILGAFIWVGALYKWLTTPLEDHH